MELPNGVKTATDLYRLYCDLENHPAWVDLRALLVRKKDYAMSKLKQIDDPVQRATWVLVDEILERREFIQKEAQREEENRRLKEKNKN